MELVIYLLLTQGVLGAFDTLFHHEFTERLSWVNYTGKELKIHSLRSFLYFVVFFTLAWWEWRGAWAWLIIAILVIEIALTLWDFVIEDKTRCLPASERILHTMLAINYGIILSVLVQTLVTWSTKTNDINSVHYGVLSWAMMFFSLGALVWTFLDSYRSVNVEKFDLYHRTNKSADPGFTNKRILITGGSGFIGKHLTRSLIHYGNHVTVVTRNKSDAAKGIQGRIALVDSLTELTNHDQFDVVINLAGEPITSGRWTERKKKTIRDSRIETTRQLINFMKATQHKPDLLINGSAIGFYGASDDRILTENSEPVSQNFSHNLCHDWEQIALKAVKQGIRVCLLRTGIVLERDGGALSRMIVPFYFCGGGPMGSGSQWMSWIHRDDLIALIFYCVHHQELQGPINGTAPEVVNNREFTKTLGRVMKRPAFMPLPAFVLKFIFGQMGDELLLQGQRVVPHKVLQHGFQFKYPKLDKALNSILYPRLS